MKKLLLVAAVLTGIGVASESQAQAGGLNFRVNFNLPLPPLPGLVISRPAPVYAPVTVAPVCEPVAPVYAPAPVAVCEPASAVVTSPPVICAPAPVIVERPHVYYGHERFDHNGRRYAYNNNSWNNGRDLHGSSHGDHRR